MIPRHRRFPILISGYGTTWTDCSAPPAVFQEGMMRQSCFTKAIKAASGPQ